MRVDRFFPLASWPVNLSKKTIGIPFYRRNTFEINFNQIQNIPKVKVFAVKSLLYGNSDYETVPSDLCRIYAYFFYKFKDLIRESCLG